MGKNVENKQTSRDPREMTAAERYSAAQAEVDAVCEKYGVVLQSSTIETDGMPIQRGPVAFRVLALPPEPDEQPENPASESIEPEEDTPDA